MLQQGLYFGNEYTIDSTDVSIPSEVAEASGYATPADFLAAKASGFTVSVSTDNHMIMQVTPK